MENPFSRENARQGNDFELKDREGLTCSDFGGEPVGWEIFDSSAGNFAIVDEDLFDTSHTTRSQHSESGQRAIFEDTKYSQPWSEKVQSLEETCVIAHKTIWEAHVEPG